MIGRKTVGRAIFFGLGYLAGTRAGRERYAQIEAGAKAVVARLRPSAADATSSGTSSGSSSKDSSDPYRDIKLGD